VAVLLAAGHLTRVHADGLTLKQCIEAAYGLSPALKADELDIDAAGDEIIKQRTALLPDLYASISPEVIDGYPVSPFAVATGEDIEEGTVGVSAKQAETTTTRTTTLGSGKTRTANIVTEKAINTEALPRQLHRANFVPLSIEKIESDYPLFQNGSILGLNDAPAVASAQAAKEQLEWTKQLGEEKVVFDLCNAFFLAQWYQQKLARDEARVHFSQQRLDIVKVQYQLQLMLAQDVELAKAQLIADEQTLASTKESVKDSYATLAVLIGQPANRVVELVGTPPEFPALPDLDGLLARAREIHPAVGVQETAIEIARQAYKLDQAALLPAVLATTTYSLGQNFSHFSTASAESPTNFAAGITVNVPIFDWGSRLAEERESRIKLASASAEEDQVKMDVSTTITALYDAVNNLDQQFQQAVQAQVSAANAAMLAREQRSTGALDQLTLVGDELALLSAEDTTESTLLTALETYTQLEQAAGGAWRWQQ
jgi:outer membrane protein TolC